MNRNEALEAALLFIEGELPFDTFKHSIQICKQENEKIINATYLIGQRVILNNKEIGKIVPSEPGILSTSIRVFSPSRGYESDYALTNIKPLPNEQL